MDYHKSISPPSNVDMSDQYQTPGRGWRDGRMKDERKGSSVINLSAGWTLCRHTTGWQRRAERVQNERRAGTDHFIFLFDALSESCENSHTFLLMERKK